MAADHVSSIVGFNGAAALTLRKLAEAAEQAVAPTPASMGPQR